MVNPKKTDPLQTHVLGQAGRLFPFFRVRFRIKVVAPCQEKNDHRKSSVIEQLRRDEIFASFLGKGMRIPAPIWFRKAAYPVGNVKNSLLSGAEWIDFMRHSC
jgi:hypothetical protein